MTLFHIGRYVGKSVTIKFDFEHANQIVEEGDKSKSFYIILTVPAKFGSYDIKVYYFDTANLSFYQTAEIL